MRSVGGARHSNEVMGGARHNNEVGGKAPTLEIILKNILLFHYASNIYRSFIAIFHLKELHCFAGRLNKVLSFCVLLVPSGGVLWCFNQSYLHIVCFWSHICAHCVCCLRVYR